MRSSGRECWAGVLGVVQAVALIAWPAQVGLDRYSYPQTPDVAALTQVTFFAQHLLLVAGLLALLGEAERRVARVALGIGAGAMALLAVMELVAVAAVGQPADSPLAQTVGESCVSTGHVRRFDRNAVVVDWRVWRASKKSWKKLGGATRAAPLLSVGVAILGA